MPYSYLMISRIIHGANYTRQLDTLYAFEQFAALYMHNLWQTSDPAGIRA